MVTDTFDSSHDYSGGNVAGTIWDGIRYNEGNISSVVANANTNTSSACELQFESANGEWYLTANDGLFLYWNVTGDFVARVEVTSANDVQYHDLGLMVRVANDADAGEDWVAMRHFADFSQNRIRSTDNGAGDNTSSFSFHTFLEIERSGNDIILRHDADGIGAYTTVDTYSRADFDGLPLQVGIWQATFSGNVGVATFDDFSLEGSQVPEPASLAMLGLGGLLIAGRRRRRQ